MRNWLSKNMNSIIIGSFLVPILLVAFVSISHVTSFYKLSNPFTWAIYLSVAVEVAALAALAGISAKFGKFIYIPFGIVTLIQLIGNFFFSYTWIDINTKEFKDWVDMIGGILEPIGVDSTDLVSQRRILGFLTGGLLPFISLTFAHMLIVYSTKIKEQNEKEQNDNSKKKLKKKKLTEDEIIDLSKRIAKEEKEKDDKYKPYNPTDNDLNKIEEILKQNYVEKKENNSEPIREVEIKIDEPSYYVDDVPIIEETKPDRLVYTKNE